MTLLAGLQGSAVSMPRLTLYRFRYFDPLRQRWQRAGRALEAPEIRCRYSDYELMGSPEVRRVAGAELALSAAHFRPFAVPALCQKGR